MDLVASDDVTDKFVDPIFLFSASRKLFNLPHNRLCNQIRKRSMWYPAVRGACILTSLGVYGNRRSWKPLNVDLKERVTMCFYAVNKWYTFTIRWNDTDAIIAAGRDCNFCHRSLRSNSCYTECWRSSSKGVPWQYNLRSWFEHYIRPVCGACPETKAALESDWTITILASASWLRTLLPGIATSKSGMRTFTQLWKACTFRKERRCPAMSKLHSWECGAWHV